MQIEQGMKRFLSRTFVRQVIFVSALVGLLIVAAHLWPTAQYALPVKAGDLKPASELFAHDIRVFGGAKAYARLSTALQGYLDEDQHAYAHAFGHELYKIEGEHGVSACGVDFGLGCFHQFLGDAITELGTDSAQRLYDSCTRVAGNQELCRHGLGHGILSGVGYAEKDLQKALDVCGSITREVTYAGCGGGVFMEYNLRTIANAEGIAGSRDVDSGGIYAPCESVHADNRQVCTFWLPEWWFFAVLKGNQMQGSRSDVYAQMGELCAASTYPQTCYEGIGYFTPTAFGSNPAEIRAACDSAGERGGANAYCRGTAAIILQSTRETRELGPGMCDGLSGRPEMVCKQYVAHKGDFSFSSSEHL